MNQDKSSNKNIKISAFPIESGENNFECAFKEVFQPKDDIIGEEAEENMRIDEYDEIYYSSSQNFASENDSAFNIKNNINLRKISENKIEFHEKNKAINIDELEPKQENNKQKDNKKIEAEKILPLNQKIENKKIDTEIQNKKINPFRVYNSTEFNIFHPGGNCPSYNKIKQEINDLEQMQTINNTCNCNKFKVHKKSKIRRKRNKKTKIERKRKPDNIRKKIKSRFFKSLKIRLNQILKSAKSKELFDLLPQCFIINITKKVNKAVIDMTLQKLFSCNFITEEPKIEDKEVVNKMRKTDLKKYERNTNVIKYLENNDIISKSSKFNIIGNMTFSEIFEEYLKSDEFEKEIIKLEKEGNDEYYIKDYIVKALGFIKYFH